MLLYSVVGIHKRTTCNYRISVYFASFEQAEEYKTDIQTKSKQYKDLNIKTDNIPVEKLDLVSYVNELGNLIVDGVPTRFYYSKTA